MKWEQGPQRKGFWRRAHSRGGGLAQERRFVFNPAQAVTDADRNAVRAKFLAKMHGLEASMTSGPPELHRLAKELQARKSSYDYQLAAAAKTVAQAKADLALIE